MSRRQREKGKALEAIDQVFDSVQLHVDDDKTPVYIGWEQRPDEHTQETEPEPFNISIDWSLRLIHISRGLEPHSEMPQSVLDDHRTRLESRARQEPSLEGYLVRANEEYVPWRIDWHVKNIDTFDQALNQFCGKNRICLADALNDEQRWNGLEEMRISSMHNLAPAVYIMSLPKDNAYDVMNRYLCRPEKFRGIYHYLGGKVRFPFFIEDLAHVLSALTDLDEFLSFRFVSKMSKDKRISWTWADLDKKLSEDWREQFRELAEGAVSGAEYLAVAQRLCSQLDVQF